MTEKTIKCAECNVEFTYEENPKYPRKYCLNCSAKKKKEYAEVVEPGFDDTPIPAPKKDKNGKEFHLTEEAIRSNALRCAVEWCRNTGIDFWKEVKAFEEYIRHGK